MEDGDRDECRQSPISPSSVRSLKIHASRCQQQANRIQSAKYMKQMKLIKRGQLHSMMVVKMSINFFAFILTPVRVLVRTVPFFLTSLWRVFSLNFSSFLLRTRSVVASGFWIFNAFDWNVGLPCSSSMDKRSSFSSMFDLERSPLKLKLGDISILWVSE